VGAAAAPGARRARLTTDATAAVQQLRDLLDCDLAGGPGRLGQPVPVGVLAGVVGRRARPGRG
jgi:hypothetical protein